MLLGRRAVLDISGVLACLPRLHSLHIESPISPDFVPLPGLGPCSQLKYLTVVSDSNTSDSIPRLTIEYTKQEFLQSLARTLARTPRLERLAVVPRISPNFGYKNNYKLVELFGLDCIARCPPLSLRYLVLDYWMVTPLGVEAMLPHIRHLTSLVLGKYITGDGDALWGALATTGTCLSVLEARASKRLMDYLGSYEGIVRLKLWYMSFKYDTYIVPILHVHRASLKDLSIFLRYHQDHGYNDILSRAISECKNLQRLAINVQQWVILSIFSFIYSDTFRSNF